MKTEPSNTAPFLEKKSTGTEGIVLLCIGGLALAGYIAWSSLSKPKPYVAPDPHSAEEVDKRAKENNSHAQTYAMIYADDHYDEQATDRAIKEVDNLRPYDDGLTARIHLLRDALKEEKEALHWKATTAKIYQHPERSELDKEKVDKSEADVAKARQKIYDAKKIIAEWRP